MSELLKIARAVAGDEFFAMRVRIACELAATAYTRHILLHVAKAVVDAIECDAEGTVTTTGVSDQAIITAVSAASLGGDHAAS